MTPQDPRNLPWWAWLLVLLAIVLAMLAVNPPTSSAEPIGGSWTEEPYELLFVAPGDFVHVPYRPSDFDAYDLKGRPLRQSFPRENGRRTWAADGYGIHLVYERTNSDVINNGRRTALVFVWKG